MFIVSPFLTEGKIAIFSKSEPLPIDRREKTSDHKPPEPRSLVACHPVTHLNLKTAAFSFIFCHFVAAVFLLMRPLTINFCIVNAVQKLDPSHKLGMLTLSRCIAPSFHHDGKQKKNILFKSWRDQSSGEGEFKTEGDMTQRWEGTEGDEWQEFGDWGVQKILALWIL